MEKWFQRLVIWPIAIVAFGYATWELIRDGYPLSLWCLGLLAAGALYIAAMRDPIDTVLKHRQAVEDSAKPEPASLVISYMGWMVVAIANVLYLFGNMPVGVWVFFNAIGLGLVGLGLLAKHIASRRVPGGPD